MARKSIYGVHPGVAMIQHAIASLPEKTGRSLDAWIAFMQKHGPKSEAARREWLKKEHKLGTNYAWWIAERAEGKGENGDPISTSKSPSATSRTCSPAARPRCGRSTTRC